MNDATAVRAEPREGTQAAAQSSGAGPPAPELPRGLYAYIWRISGRAQILLSLISVFVFLLDLVPLELQRRIVNDALQRQAMSRLVWLALAYVAVALVQGAAKLLNNVYRAAVSERANRRLRLETYERALLGPPAEAEDGKEGIGISIILAEVEPVGGFVGSSVSEPVLHAGVLLSVFGYLLYLQPWMALVAFFVFAPQFVFVPLLTEAINRRTESRIRVLRRLSVDIISETDERRRRRGAAVFRGRVDQVYQLNMEIYRRKFSMNFLMNFLHHFGIIAILFLGGWFVIQGRIEVGTVVAFISGLNRVNDPWGDLVNFFRELTNARVKYGLIARFLNAAQPDPARAAAAS